MPEKISEKMKLAAVVCELDPLHFGHQWLFRQAKERADGLVCVLSGNFVQRGEPALLDKWARTKLALENGGDLVLELPLPWACAGAERFAAGAVHLASALGNVELLAFGSEISDTALLEKIAEALLSPEFSQAFASLPDNGQTFARRREEALCALLGLEVLPALRSPNATLAIEYLKALKRENSPITPLAFPRQGAGHDLSSDGSQFRSASELRTLFRRGRPLGGLAPETTVSLLEELAKKGAAPAEPERLERSILCSLRIMEPTDFAALPDVSEGLENRLFEAARRACSLEEFYELAKSKRYTHARIRRLALYAFLGVTGSLPALPPYLRVLGMTDKGERILKEASPALPLAVRAADFEKLGGQSLELFRLEARAGDLYALALPRPTPCGRDYTEKLIRN